MPAIWTDPRTWAASEVLTAALMNEQLRDNLYWLKDPPSFSQRPNNITASTTSATYVAVSGSLQSLISVRNSGLLLGFTMYNLSCSAAGETVYVGIQIDGTTVGQWAHECPANNASMSATAQFYEASVTPETRTIRLVWAVTGGATISLSSGTSVTYMWGIEQ